MKAQINKDLYKLVTNKNGKPDLLAIHLYKHIKNELPNSKCSELISSYSYLTRRYKCSQETIRLRLVKLEKLGLIKKQFQRKICGPDIYVMNVLTISLVRGGRA